MVASWGVGGVCLGDKVGRLGTTCHWFVPGFLAYVISYKLVRGLEGCTGAEEDVPLDNIGIGLMFQCFFLAFSPFTWSQASGSVLKAPFTRRQAYESDYDVPVDVFQCCPCKWAFPQVFLSISRNVKLLCALWQSLWSKLFSLWLEKFVGPPETNQNWKYQNASGGSGLMEPMCWI